jgi:hypothetical protein
VVIIYRSRKKKERHKVMVYNHGKIKILNQWKKEGSSKIVGGKVKIGEKNVFPSSFKDH